LSVIFSVLLFLRFVQKLNHQRGQHLYDLPALHLWEIAPRNLLFLEERELDLRG